MVGARFKYICSEKTENTNRFQITLEPADLDLPSVENNERRFACKVRGNIEITTISEEAAEQFRPGKEYCVDISPAE